ncbi:MAG TPA: aldolase/citrate lyase family protein [Chloroflexota bacterium]|jgi:2-keto-3-deoxy-L-rhamnonate aldolase RhmA
MRPNELAARLAAGAAVVGPLLSFNSPELVEVCGFAGFDFVLIDAEHNLVGPESCQQLVRAAEVAGLTALVRVPRNDQATILGFLETGVQGVVVPHVRGAVDAAAAVAAVKYPPIGRRSAAGSSRPANYGLTQTAGEYFALANERTMVIALVEEVEGFENLEAIGRTPGIDLLFLGDGDLAMDMGRPGQREHPAVRRVVEDAVVRGRAANLLLGGPATTAAAAGKLVGAGFRFVLVPLAGLFAAPAREVVRAVRGAG